MMRWRCNWRALPRWQPVQLLLCCLVMGLSQRCQAKIVEEILTLPVSVTTYFGITVHQPIVVTVFREDTREKAPFLILNHGRPASEAEFAQMKRQRYPANSRYFVERGFVVFVPTRVGYGDSGGPDAEYSGKCETRDYPPAYAAAAQQSAALIQHLPKLPYVDPGRGLAVGQSFGGTTAIALASMPLPGLVATVNFAGGGGGNPVTRPENPCGAYQMKRLLAGYGKTNRLPTLWLYSENDRFWGPDLPKTWFAAFQEAGGKGRFVSLPPYKDNGHSIFSGNPDAWKAAFEAFIHEHGF